MAHSVAGKISSIFSCKDKSENNPFYLLPFNFDSLVYVILFMYLHYNNLCLMGFCNDRSCQTCMYDVCAASYIYLIASAVFSSQFTWWPCELGPVPKGVLNILYKVWVGILLHNFAERLLWHAVCEVISWYLNGFAFLLEWITQKLNVNNYSYCNFDWLRKGAAHEIILTIVALYVLYRVLNKNGFLSLSIPFAKEFKTSDLRNNAMSNRNLLASRNAIASRGGKPCPRHKTKPRGCESFGLNNQKQRVRLPHHSNDLVENNVLHCHQNICNPFNNLSYRIHPATCFHSDVIPSHPYEDYSNHVIPNQSHCNCGNFCQPNITVSALESGSDDSSNLGDTHYWEDGDSQNLQNFKGLDQSNAEHNLSVSENFNETLNSRTHQQNESQIEGPLVYHKFHNTTNEDGSCMSKPVDEIDCCGQEESGIEKKPDVYPYHLNSKLPPNSQNCIQHSDRPCSSNASCPSEHTTVIKQPHISSKQQPFLTDANQSYNEEPSFNQVEPKPECSSFIGKQCDFNKNEVVHCDVPPNYYPSNKNISQNMAYVQEPSKQMSLKLFSFENGRLRKQKLKKSRIPAKKNSQNNENNKQCQDNNSDSEG